MAEAFRQSCEFLPLQPIIPALRDGLRRALRRYPVSISQPCLITHIHFAVIMKLRARAKRVLKLRFQSGGHSPCKALYFVQVIFEQNLFAITLPTFTAARSQ